MPRPRTSIACRQDRFRTPAGAAFRKTVPMSASDAIATVRSHCAKPTHSAGGGLFSSCVIGGMRPRRPSLSAETCGAPRRRPDLPRVCRRPVGDPAAAGRNLRRRGGCRLAAVSGPGAAIDSKAGFGPKLPLGGGQSKSALPRYFRRLPARRWPRRHRLLFRDSGPCSRSCDVPARAVPLGDCLYADK